VIAAITRCGSRIIKRRRRMTSSAAPLGRRCGWCRIRWICESGARSMGCQRRRGRDRGHLPVSRAWVHRMVQRRRETGSIAPLQQTKFRRVLAGQEDRLAALITARPDATLAELREALPTTAALSRNPRTSRTCGWTDRSRQLRFPRRLACERRSGFWPNTSASPIDRGGPKGSALHRNEKRTN